MDTFNAIRLAYPEVIYACLTLILGALLFIPSCGNDFICINKHSWDIFHSKAKKKFEYHAFTLLKEGLEKVSREISGSLGKRLTCLGPFGFPTGDKYGNLFGSDRQLRRGN